MTALRFIGVLAVSAALLLLLRAIDPWLIDGIAVYASYAFAAIALVTALAGLAGS